MRFQVIDDKKLRLEENRLSILLHMWLLRDLSSGIEIRFGVCPAFRTDFSCPLSTTMTSCRRG